MDAPAAGARALGCASSGGMSGAVAGPCDTGVAAAALPQSNPHPRATLAATILGSSVAFIDGSVVNVALPALARDLGAGPAELSWTINAYLLPLGALILLGGGAGDHFGRRRLFLVGLAIFTVASLLSPRPRLCLGCSPAAACKGWARRSSCRTASRSSAPHSPARRGDGRSAPGRRPGRWRGRSAHSSAVGWSTRPAGARSSL